MITEKKRFHYCKWLHNYSINEKINKQKNENRTINTLLSIKSYSLK